MFVPLIVYGITYSYTIVNMDGIIAIEIMQSFNTISLEDGIPTYEAMVNTRNLSNKKMEHVPSTSGSGPTGVLMSQKWVELKGKLVRSNYIVKKYQNFQFLQASRCHPHISFFPKKWILH